MPAPPPDPWALLFAAARGLNQSVYPGRELESVTLRFRDGGKALLPLPSCPCPPSPARGEGPPGRSHAADFRSVRWGGRTYSLTRKRAKVVEALWQAWEQGTPEVGQAALLRAADSESVRLVDLFRDDPAWGSLVVGGATPGTYRLAGDGPTLGPTQPS